MPASATEGGHNYHSVHRRVGLISVDSVHAATYLCLISEHRS